MLLMKCLAECRNKFMSNLLNNPNLNKEQDPLDRGNDISPKTTFKVSDLNNQKQS